jgi:dihydroneopterin aldolase
MKIDKLAGSKTTICIRNLHLRTVLGVYEKERLSDREVVVNLSFVVPQSCSGAADNLDSAVDYAAVRDKLTKVASESRARLLEHLAELMLRRIIEDERILCVTLRVDKPGALREAECVSVTKEWSQASANEVPHSMATTDKNVLAATNIEATQ